MDEEDLNSLDLILDTTILNTRGWTTQEWLLTQDDTFFEEHNLLSMQKSLNRTK